MSDRYAVFGNPVAHSKSPVIHAAFAQQTGQDMVYDRQLVDIDKFSEVAQDFFAAGGCGLNITVPFKLDAYTFAHQLSERAQQAGAVNTLKKMPDGKIFGDNTDGVGMLRDIKKNLGWDIAGKRVLVLGAGGAVRGVIGPLLAERPQRLLLANRTLSKAEALVQLFNTGKSLADAKILRASSLQIHARPFDIVINGTSASLGGELPDLSPAILADEACCYDMMYGKTLTPFLQWSQQHGARVADGLGMLVEQAAESFYLWRGVRPDTAPVMAMLRES
ncbi:MAG TPA: shikimate dehydrogenase [Pseudomonadales bacterium]|nr:shikimate dehydrogenase [Pseudomonadales bacterium]